MRQTREGVGDEMRRRHGKLERCDGAMNEVDLSGHECVLVVTGSGNPIASVAFRLTSFPILFAGFVFVIAGSVIVIRSRLIQ